MIDNYADLPIGLYQDIEAVSKDTDRDELDRQVAIVALLSGIAEKDLLALPIADYSALAAKTAFLAQPCPEGRTARQYIVGPFTLVPTDDLARINTAQYIDFQQMAGDPEGNFVALLSIFLLPKGKRYNEDYDIAEVQAAIREHLSVQDAITLSAYFFGLWASLTRVTLNSSERLARKIRNPEKRKELTEQARALRKMLAGMASPVAGGGSTTSTGPARRCAARGTTSSTNPQ